MATTTNMLAKETGIAYLYTVGCGPKMFSSMSGQLAAAPMPRGHNSPYVSNSGAGVVSPFRPSDAAPPRPSTTPSARPSWSSSSRWSGPPAPPPAALSSSSCPPKSLSCPSTSPRPWRLRSSLPTAAWVVPRLRLPPPSWWLRCVRSAPAGAASARTASDVPLVSTQTALQGTKRALEEQTPAPPPLCEKSTTAKHPASSSHCNFEPFRVLEFGGIR
mmetsp:Transcript_60898/g.170285  ORF Transcript_60898/g.170285 Transcript_60898/m.170285 type:complete len:217 (+) Transcript_60898:911-1561(+)